MSSLVQLPDYIPGPGTLYPDPPTAPVGPYLGYDKSGKLANATYMIPLKQFEGRKGFEGPVRGGKVCRFPLEPAAAEVKPR